MAVVKRGKVWQVQVRVGKDPRTGKWIRQSATADTKAKAEALERRMLAEAEGNRARFVDPTQDTLAAFLADYLEREGERLRRKTHAEYARMVRVHIAPALGAISLADLSPRKVQGFLDGMGARAITEKVRKFLVTALSDAERLGMVTVNAAGRTRAPYRPAPKRPSFALEEARAVLEAMGDSPYRPAAEVALYTGLRRGEVLGLRWEDVDFAAPSVRVRRQVATDNGSAFLQDLPKTAAGRREVPLVPDALAVLRAQRAAVAAHGGAVPATGWVFPGRSAVGTLHPTGLTERFKAAVGVAQMPDADGRPTVGIPDLPLHALRHTTASLLLSAGVPAEQAAKIMGHASLAVFYRTYADLLRPGAQDAADRLARYLEAQARAVPKVASVAGMSANTSANPGRAPASPSGRRRSTKA